jgi:hypothetical protein
MRKICKKALRGVRAMRTLVRLTVLVAVFATTVFAADPPYVGKWKLNPAKSDFGETTVTYEQTAGGDMKLTADGQSYIPTRLRYLGISGQMENKEPENRFSRNFDDSR